MELSEDDVLHILKLIDESKFDYFQLEVGELKITVSKGDPLPPTPAPQNAAAAPASVSTPAAAAKHAAGTATTPDPPQPPKAAAIPPGLMPITAPLLGTFYVASEPGAPPFVKVGDTVNEDTTVGLIEVMKVFNSVRSGVNGVVTEAVAQNGQFVEHGQTLFLVKPA